MTDKKESEDSRVKPADALGTLSERARASRVYGLVSVVIVFFLLVFIVGMVVRSVLNGSNTPDIPSVNFDQENF